VAETNLTIRLAEAAEQERQIETLRATIQECTAWFDEDARAALTNDTCNSIFVSGGLPNSKISGPSTSEILLAELVNINAKVELQILIRTGRLLETTASNVEVAEGDDPYDCDQ
jgi:hypothetical protein